MNQKLLAQLLVIFIVTQALGLITGFELVKYFEQKPEDRPGVVSQNPEDIGNSFALVVWILVSTAAMLLLIKFFKGRNLALLLKLLEAFAVFGAAWIVASVFAGDTIGLFFALALVAAKNFFKQSFLVKNIASVFAAAGAGAIIGTIFGIVPVLVFIVLLALYDYIAVFKTRHMVTLAKAIVKENLAFTFALPTKEHKFELGTGDMVIPLAFSVSVLMDNYNRIAFPKVFLPSIAVEIASIAGLLLTMEYVSKRVGTAVPALPLQTAFMVIAFVVSGLLL